MPSSNTRDCFREFVGMRMVGLLFDALPFQRADLAAGSTALIFEDGRALVIHANGAYYIEAVDRVKQVVLEHAERLKQLQKETAEVIVLSGVL